MLFLLKRATEKNPCTHSRVIQRQRDLVLEVSTIKKNTGRRPPVV